MNATPKEVTVDLDLGDRPAVCKVDKYRNVWQITLRYMYNDPETGQLRYGKNGINMPIVDVPQAVRTLIDTYNEATGGDLLSEMFEGV